MKNNHIIRVLACVLCLLFAVGVGFSQAGFGAKVGANFSNVTVSGDGLETSGKTDLGLGLFFELPVTQNFIIQPEFTYMGRGYKANLASVENTYNVAYIDLGALAKVRFGDQVGVYIGAGPFFSYAVSGQIKNPQGRVDLDFEADSYKRSDFTLATALGLEFGSRDALRFFVDARYLMGLSDQNDSDVTTYSIKNRVLGLNGGIIIPL